ncbi:cell death activator CIDE-B-like [Trachemys scripta elegans]|uniref:cell death activator CIDE-B-like n=1 Tax=Trachemys scripta elegans TaxID=31138 RepID=UPI0015551AF7|nr:cell death activator CIDE-B-like [Trachemys scripta elegans]
MDYVSALAPASLLQSVSSAGSELTRRVWAPRAPPQRPFRVCNHRRGGRTGLMAGTLQELLAKAMEALLVAGLARLVLEEDGTAVESEAFFQTLPPDTALMLLGAGQTWSPPRVSEPSPTLRPPHPPYSPYRGDPTNTPQPPTTPAMETPPAPN